MKDRLPLYSDKLILHVAVSWRVEGGMEDMISRWIMETKNAYQQAVREQNLYKMFNMRKLENALRQLKDRLL
jgi:hypothetical protein